MTEKEASRRAKWFGAGVRANIWAYANPVRWEVSISRGVSIGFLNLDKLNRAVWDLRKSVESGSDNLELWGSDEHPVTFHGPQDAYECVTEIEKAIKYIQSESDDDEWKPVPHDLYLGWRWEDVA